MFKMYLLGQYPPQHFKNNYLHDPVFINAPSSLLRIPLQNYTEPFYQLVSDNSGRKYINKMCNSSTDDSFIAGWGFLLLSCFFMNEISTGLISSSRDKELLNVLYLTAICN